VLPAGPGDGGLVTCSFNRAFPTAPEVVLTASEDPAGLTFAMKASMPPRRLAIGPTTKGNVFLPDSVIPIT
jgi:hypothetical protein